MIMEGALVVDLKTQDNYIETENRRFSYRKEIVFSRDLLTGKRNCRQIFLNFSSYFNFSLLE